MTNEELTAIYNEANGLDPKRHNPINTERIFAAMRGAMAVEREAYSRKMFFDLWAALPAHEATGDTAASLRAMLMLSEVGDEIKARSNVDVTGPCLHGSGGQQGSAAPEPSSGD
jgi:hypothetical protein